MNESRRASDELLLRMIREGRHDAEVAVRLGITTGELRERKADLRNRLGHERYAELTSATAPVRHRRRRGLWWGGGVAAAAATLLAAANLLDRGGDASEPPARESATAAATSFALIAGPLVEIEGRQFRDLGRVLRPSNASTDAVGIADHRAAMEVVPLVETVFLTNSASVEWTVVSNSLKDAYLRAVLSGRQIDVAIHAIGEGRVRRVATGVGPVLELQDTGGRPGTTLLIQATEGTQPLEVHITRDGRMLIAEEALPAGTVLDNFTGAAIDVSGARPFGTMSRTVVPETQNACEPTGGAPGGEALRCRVVWNRWIRGFTVPVDGVYSCSGARSLEFRGDGVRLVFVLRGEASTAFACEPSEVSAGMMIVPDGEWVVAALNAEDAPLSIVVGMDGQVYVGEVRGIVTCPCAPS
jgi:hypothetical protein